MVKELVIAILLGSTLGFILTGSFLGLSKNKSLFNKSSGPTPTIQSNLTPTTFSDNITTVTPTPAVNLTVTSPTNNSISNTAKITITGNTQPQNLIIIKNSKNTYTGDADDTGAFSIPIELESGINIVQIVSFDQDDNQAEIDLNITYSTAKI